MKFFSSNSGLARSLAALSVCLGLVISLCIPAGAARQLARDQKEAANAQTDVKMFSAAATATTSGVTVQWRTILDADNLGFNLYRLKNGTRARANREIIPGSVFVINERLRPASSYSFSWFDRNGTSDAVYYIESVSVRGVSEIDNRAITVTQKPDVGIAQIAGTQGASPVESAASGDSAAQKSFPAAEQAQPLLPNGPLENQWDIAAKPGLKISIIRDGWYRVTQPDMAGAGFNPTVDIRNLRLFADGQEVAINTNQAVGVFGSGDYIEFYGRGIDLPTSDTRTYYLIADTVPGKRVRGEIHLDAAPTVPPSLLLPPIATEHVVPKSPWFGFVWTFLNLPEAASTTSASKRAIARMSNANEPKTIETEPASNAPASTVTREQINAVAPATRKLLGIVTPNEQPRLQETPITQPGTKKASAQKKPKRRKKTSRKYNHAEIANAIAPASFDYTVQRKDRSNYFLNVLNGDAENFFGQFFANNPVSQTIDLSNPQLTAAGAAQLEIALQGVSLLPHQVNIQFNNVPIGSFNYFGVAHSVQVFDVSTLLQAGANTLTFSPVAGGGVSFIDYTRVTYPHAYRADNGALKFNLRGTQSLKVDGFSTPDIRLIDYTDPLSVGLSTPAAEASSSGYAITVPTSAPRSKSQRLLYAIPNGQFEQPAALILNQPSTLNSGNLSPTITSGADFLIITKKNLAAALGPLVAARQTQGFTASVVDVEDIYDEFSYGLHGPQAIKDFLANASAHWAIAPRYVIFAGDATYDPRDYLGIGPNNLDLVPTKLVDATYTEAASDDWLADFDGDGTADIAIGRLPVRNPAEASLVISKIANFAPANVPQQALLIADDPGTPPLFDFESATDSVQALLPASMTVQRVNVRTEGAAQASTNIINGFNQGRAVVNYSGHGNVDVWSGSSVFHASDATALTNGNKLPFVIVMDCLNGYFHEPILLSLSEAFLEAPNGGAVAAFASSGLTTTPGQRQMELQLYSSLYGAQSVALGDAIKTAKAATTDVDVRRTWIYFGDPSLKIR